MTRTKPSELPMLIPPNITAIAAVFDVLAHLDSDMLVRRADGEELGRKLRERFQTLHPGQVLVVDFSGVRVTGFFALQDALTVLCTAVPGRVTEEKFVVIRADEGNSDLFEALHLIGRQRNCVIPSISTAGRWRLAGKLTHAERATLESVMDAGALTASQLQKRLHLLPSAASNRLRKLFQMRIVRREERIRDIHGGREFVYMPLCVSVGGPQRRLHE